MPLQTNAPSLPTASSRRQMLVLMSLSTLYHYMYCMMVSSAFSLTPVLGGALMMSAQVATALAHAVAGDRGQGLPRAMRAAGIAFLGFVLLCNLAFLALYPVPMNPYGLWLLFTVVLLLTMRGELARRLVGKVMRRGLGKKAFVCLFALLEILPPLILAWPLFVNLAPVEAWQVLGGFALGSLLEGHGLWRERRLMAAEETPVDTDPQTLSQMAKDLREMNAYHSFQRFHTLILMALQVTLVMMYTFIGLTNEELLNCLLISVALTLILREATDALLRRLKNHRPAATQLLLIGLFLWIYGLALFYGQLELTPKVLMSYLSLGLAVGGVTVSVTCLAEVERQMTSVARYGLENDLQGYERMRAGQTELSILVGQMVALVLLTALCIPAGFWPVDASLETIVAGFRPLMIVPPLLLLVSAVVSVLHFPMNNRYFQKLARFLTLQSEGGENPALKKQLDGVVVQRHKNRFGVKLMMSLLRPWYYHKVIGKENTAGYEDGSMILICNHGELYGPIVANLYVPISFRPWVLSHMMEKEAIVEHMYQGTMVRQRWLPEKWKKPLLRSICPLLIWIFNSIEGIPVYRGQPRELIKTFRITVEAMQAGDNILLFPENGEDHAEGEKGYVQEGVGQLYTGFAILGQMYYARTGKRAVFVPVYASKKMRTLTLGQGIVYNPEAPANEEKLRIVGELQGSMQGMYEKEKDAE